MALLIRQWSDGAMHSVGDAPNGIVGLHYAHPEGFQFIVNPSREIPDELRAHTQQRADAAGGIAAGSVVIPGGLDELGSVFLTVEDVVAACEGNRERIGVWMAACEAARLAAADLPNGFIAQLEHATAFALEVYTALSETAVD